MDNQKTRYSLREALLDLGAATLAGILVAVGLHYFANYKNGIFPITRPAIT